MRLSRIWRILQIKEVEICRILHILRKPNSIIASFTKDKTISSPVFFGQRLNSLQRAALLTSFWRHWFNNLQRAALLTSLIQYHEDQAPAKILSKIGEQQLVMVNYACGFNQSKTGKYFEWIINIFSQVSLHIFVAMFSPSSHACDNC